MSSHRIWCFSFFLFFFFFLSRHRCLSLFPSLSVSLSPLLLLVPLLWHGEESRAEETVDFACSKYSLYVCGVLSSKERRDRGRFSSFVIVDVCVCVCTHVTECALILANIKDAPSSISLSSLSFSSSLPLSLSLIPLLASFCPHCLSFFFFFCLRRYALPLPLPCLFWCVSPLLHVLGGV